MRLNKAKLDKLHARVELARALLRTELERQFPVGATVEVYLAAKQKAPTRMKVLNHRHAGNGHVRACMESSKARCRRYARDVFYTDILSCSTDNVQPERAVNG